MVVHVARRYKFRQSGIYSVMSASAATSFHLFRFPSFHRVCSCHEQCSKQLKGKLGSTIDERSIHRRPPGICRLYLSLSCVLSCGRLTACAIFRCTRCVRSVGPSVTSISGKNSTEANADGKMASSVEVSAQLVVDQGVCSSLCLCSRFAWHAFVTPTQ